MRPAPMQQPDRNRPHRRVMVMMAGTLLLAVALSACGVGARALTPSSSTARVIGAMTATAAAASGAGAPPAIRVASAPIAGSPSIAAAPAKNQSSPLPILPAGQMLIRSGQIELEAGNPATLVEQVRQIAGAAIAGADAGYVADEQLQSHDATFTATITINVPAPAFATVMEQLRRLGTRVLNETSSSQDVTEQFVDVDAQLQALRATQAQLLTLLGKTQQVADTLSVQRELSNVNMQINQLEGRENYLKAHSAYSTIVVTIRPPATATKPTPSLLWSPLHALLSAIAALGTVGQGVVDALIWFLVFGIPVALVALMGLVAQRAISRTLRARRSTPTP